MISRRKIEIKLVETGVLCIELVGGWGRKAKGSGEPELRHNKMATQGGRFKRRARISEFFLWSFF